MEISFKSLMENVFDFKFQFAPFYKEKIYKPLVYSKGIFQNEIKYVPSF